MNDARPIILKLGGSAITDKAEEATPRTEIINQLAEEIKRADLTTSSLSTEAVASVTQPQQDTP